MIYFPMTASILTPGHIKCLEWLSLQDEVTVGVLTGTALSGYKEEIVPFEDRFYIIQKIAGLFNNVQVVAQNSLDPSENLKTYHCDQIASGDGWEKQELEAIDKLGVKTIDIKLLGETGKQYSSSRIYEHLKHKIGH